MNPTEIYGKTAKGLLFTKTRGKRLSKGLMQVFPLIDGKSTIGDILQHPDSPSEFALEQAIQELLEEGYIKFISGGTPLGHLTVEMAGHAGMQGFSVSDANTQMFQDAEAEVRAKKAIKERSKRAESIDLQGIIDGAIVAADSENKAQEAEEKKKREEDEKKLAAKKEAERLARVASEAREKAEQQARLAAEKNARQEAEQKARKEAERLAREQAEAQARQAAEDKKRQEAEERGRKEQARREEAEKKARQEAEQKARKEAERLAREQAEALARQEAEEKKRQEAEQRAREEAEKKARQEAERKAREEAEEQARREAEERARQEAEAAAREEAEKARLKAEAEARDAAEARARQERRLAARAREEAEAKARAEAEEQARIKAEVAAILEAEQVRIRLAEEAKAKAKAEAEEQERLRAEKKAQEEAELERVREEAKAKAKAEAEERERIKAEKKAQEEAELKRVKEEAKAKAKAEAEEQARLKAEEKAREEAEQQRIRDKEAAEASARAIEQARREAEEEARLEAERQRVRDEAEARAKAEALERARREGEEEARIEAELAAEQQRANEEAEARAKREREDRALQELEEAEKQRLDADEADSAAWEQSERLASDREKKSQREAARERKAKEKQAKASARSEALAQGKNTAVAFLLGMLPGKRVVFAALALLVVAPVVLLNFMNLGFLIEPAQKLASERLNDTVTIQSVRASLWPAPHFRLEGVSIGKIAIPAISATPVLSSLGEEVTQLKSVEIESLVVTGDMLERFLVWFPAGNRPSQLELPVINLKNARLEAKGSTLPPFNAQASFGSAGNFEHVRISDADGKAELSVFPAGDALRVVLKAREWKPLLGLDLNFSALDAEVTVDRQSLRIKSFDGLVFDGRLTAEGTVQWKKDWRAEGSFKLSHVQLGKIASELDGKVDASGSYVFSSGDPWNLFSSPQVRASFNVGEGRITGIDLARAIKPEETRNISGGETTFSELIGAMSYASQRYQFQKIKMRAGLLNASADFDLSKERASGRIAVSLESRATAFHTEMTLSGTPKAPVLKK